MDAAVLAWTEADQRRMRMGELTAATRGQARRVRRPEGLLTPPPLVQGETAGDEGDEETAAEQKSRIEREKAEWSASESRRRAFEEAMRHNLGETGKLAAQNGIPQLTALYAAQREMRRFETEKNEASTDVQTQLGASNAQIQSLVSEARNGSSSWAYRRAVLGRARVAVADHLTALRQVQDRCYEKLASFAGKPDLLSDLSVQASEVEQRRRVMEEYYGVLERLVSGNDEEGGLDRLGSAAGRVAPEVVRNSSTMRLMARRRRNFWAEIA